MGRGVERRKVFLYYLLFVLLLLSFFSFLLFVVFSPLFLRRSVGVGGGGAFLFSPFFLLT